MRKFFAWLFMIIAVVLLICASYCAGLPAITAISGTSSVAASTMFSICTFISASAWCNLGLAVLSIIVASWFDDELVYKLIDKGKNAAGKLATIPGEVIGGAIGGIGSGLGKYAFNTRFFKGCILVFCGYCGYKLVKDS